MTTASKTPSRQEQMRLLPDHTRREILRRQAEGEDFVAAFDAVTNAHMTAMFARKPERVGPPREQWLHIFVPGQRVRQQTFILGRGDIEREGTVLSVDEYGTARVEFPPLYPGVTTEPTIGLVSPTSDKVAVLSGPVRLL